MGSAARECSKMRNDLVTVTTYAGPVEANLAKNRLEASGVRAFVADQVMVQMFWYFGNAIGWIKLQVGSQDVAVAHAALNQQHGIETGPGVEPEEALSETTEFERIPEADDEEHEDDEIESIPTVRDRNAERAFRGAILGLLFLPIQLYVFYLLLRIFISNEPLGDRERRKAIIAAFINLPLMICLCVFLRGMLSSI
jgi:hypothetical protein